MFMYTKRVINISIDIFFEQFLVETVFLKLSHFSNFLIFLIDLLEK